LPVEILGSVYERFIGKIVRPKGVGVTIEEKPEVRKAGGVYYTPRYIVNYIVEQTVGQLLCSGASEKRRDSGDVQQPALHRSSATLLPPKEVAKLRILDPACGSGSFLIRAYERILEHYVEWFIEHSQEQRPRFCYKDANGDLRLTTALKRQILTDNIYGVDLDGQAVEVTQLSLYLRMLQGETKQTMNAQREMFGDQPILPPLDQNIKQGNSLIASDFSMIPDELTRVHAFDWHIGFKEIMAAGGFDAVIGNPPYLNIDDTWGKGDIQLEAIKLQYPHVYNDKTDLLFYFIAKAYDLTRNTVGFIVSRAFLEAFKADKLRGFLASKRAVSKIVDFQNFYVFDGVGITTCLLKLEKSPTSKNLDVYKLLPEELSAPNLSELLSNQKLFDHHSIARSLLSYDVWTFARPALAALNAKLDAGGQPLGKILHIGQGMQTGCNDVFGERTLLDMRTWKVPKELFRYRVSNSDIQRFEIRDRREVLLYVEDSPSFEKLPAGLRHHLEACSDKLKARAAYKRGNCDWWRFTWPLHHEYYSRARLVSPFLASENRFASVEDGRYIGLTDTIVLFENKQPESLKYLLALLNSKLLTVRFRSIGKLKGGGIYEYFWNSVSKLPIRRIDFSNPAQKRQHDELVELVDKMLALTPKLRAAKSESERQTLQNAVTATDRAIDQLVYRLYGLTEEEKKIVEEALPETAKSRKD
ncbi:MAG: Eco57I restriction-modification methylase domain-containing protein, partial [Verrucomicrobia bacterium]|nr:Eco57I restriction-modification methylase domain-containing protein [Verrucomicrobiota bacterium]